MGIELLYTSYLGRETIPELNTGGNPVETVEGVIIGRDARMEDVAAEFIKAVAQHRHWSREIKDRVPA
jgi:hypothetical protein